MDRLISIVSGKIVILSEKVENYLTAFSTAKKGVPKDVRYYTVKPAPPFVGAHSVRPQIPEKVRILIKS